MELIKELIYKAEYSPISQVRSNPGSEYGYTRSGCRGCKRGFEEGELRLVARVQSLKFDGKDSYFYHLDCFFLLQRPQSIHDIENYENIRSDDQRKISEKLELIHQKLVSQSGEFPETSKGQKRVAQSSQESSIVLNDFGVQYSVSSRAQCVGCRSRIMKGDVRVKKVVYFTEVGMRFGGQAFWHHLQCFAEICGNEYEFHLSGEELPGFSSLSTADQQMVVKALPAAGSSPLKRSKQMKTEVVDLTDDSPPRPSQNQKENVDEELESLIATQTTKLFEVRDVLDKFSRISQTNENIASPTCFSDLLKINRSCLVEGAEGNLDRCADFLTFGALAKCQRCLKGDMIFAKYGYKCNGMVDEWTECGNFEKKPLRVKCKIPDALKMFNDEIFRSKNVENRALRPYVKPKPMSNPYDIKVRRKREPLYNMLCVIIGAKLLINRAAMKAKVERMGGKLVTALQSQIAVVISNEQEVTKMSKRMQEVKSFGIQVVPESFLDNIEKCAPEETIELIKIMSICDWGTDPLSRIPQDETPGQRESMYSRGVKKVTSVKLKNGAAIDADSGLADVAHVFRKEGVLYTSVLGLADIQTNKNSYFKLQVLQSDDLRYYWVFTSWGRIGTKIGDTKKEQLPTAEQACVEFERIYKVNTGNNWNSRGSFQKIPGKYYPIDVDYENDTNQLKKMSAESAIPSRLQQPVQDLVKMLFDVEFMKQTMMEFELDLDKMPLGRLSKKQLQEANQTLSDISNLTARGASDAEFIGLSNKFYTLVPHNFGMKKVPLINTLDMIKNKREMVELLLEIEIAYSMLQVDTNDEVNPLDYRYEQLKTRLDPLNHDSDEFKLIETYISNTHAETHKDYTLVVEDVFKVQREGEASRYKPFKKLHNRQLLWHGSRLTNFVGILSHGLKIAPPEAPPSGYMFGKGVYFADMVSKSANYCFTSAQQPIGLMLLSEVALGNTHDLTRSKYITKLPDGKHSTKGLGKTFPDPNMAHTGSDGVVIPLGKPVARTDIDTALFYNEYIVYDCAQVNVKYLLKMKFNHLH